MTIFNTIVGGHECQCRVTLYRPAVPMRVTGTGFGDADPPEPEEFEFELLDAAGQVAPWLNRYVTTVTVGRLRDEFLALSNED